MGSFYVSMTTKGPGQDDLAAVLSRLGRKAFISRTISGFTVFCDSQAESQDPRLIAELARTVSGECACPLLAVLNHDDDVLWYGLYENGEQVDEYDSFPGYFEGRSSAPSGGDASKLCTAFGVLNAETTVDSILRKPHAKEGYVIEMDRHADLVAALGAPGFSPGFGYRYTENGELPEGLEETDLRPI